MGKLFLHIFVFALVTAAVAAACLWMVAMEERKKNPPRHSHRR